MTDQKPMSEQIALAAARHALRNAPMHLAPQQAIELAYGLLWQLPSRARQSLDGVKLARQALLEQLDRDGQARGITAARQLLESRKNP